MVLKISKALQGLPKHNFQHSLIINTLRNLAFATHIYSFINGGIVRTAFVLLIGLLKSILNAVAQLRDLIDNGQLDDSADNATLNRIIVILDQIGSTSLLAWSDLTQIIELFKKENPDKNVAS